MDHKQKYVGVMSGTSMDGIDCVLVEIDQGKVCTLHHYDHPMPDEIKQSLESICLGQETTLPQIGALDHRLGHLYADAILTLLTQAKVTPCEVTAIGNHGQTVFHSPNGDAPFTIQLGDANIIAARTGIQTVADFRRKDMALGGQGAPLVPAFHREVFSDHHMENTKVILNIGGIANISVLQPSSPLIGYDTGPGNTLMDAWCNLHFRCRYDKGGQWAARGNVLPELLQVMLEDDYLARPYPKSTGREHFHLDWLTHHLAKLHTLEQQPSDSQEKPEDILRTLLEFTAVTIANSIAPFHHGNDAQVIVCGGGAHNPLLMERIAQHLPAWQVLSSESYNISADHMEAIAFAWLAYRRIHGLTSNAPDVTGASRAASLGVIYPAD